MLSRENSLNPVIPRFYRDIHMKMIQKFSLSLAVISTLSIVMTGCGAATDMMNAEDNVNTDSTAGSYDLRDYIFPSSNTVIMYQEYEAYTDNIADAYKWYSGRQDTIEVNGNTITSTDEDGYEIVLSVSPDKLVMTAEDINMTIEFDRSVKVGNTIMTKNVNETGEDGETVRGTMFCKLAAQYSSKTFTVAGDSYSYNDVLEIVCTADIEYTYTEGTENIIEKDFDMTTSYMAKGIGEVVFYNKDCLDDNYDINDTLDECLSTYHEWEFALLEGSSEDNLEQTTSVEDVLAMERVTQIR
jgi:hypothetical protein